MNHLRTSTWEKLGKGVTVGGLVLSAGYFGLQIAKAQERISQMVTAAVEDRESFENTDIRKSLGYKNNYPHEETYRHYSKGNIVGYEKKEAIEYKSLQPEVKLRNQRIEKDFLPDWAHRPSEEADKSFNLAKFMGIKVKSVYGKKELMTESFPREQIWEKAPGSGLPNPGVYSEPVKIVTPLVTISADDWNKFKKNSDKGLIYGMPIVLSFGLFTLMVMNHYSLNRRYKREDEKEKHREILDRQKEVVRVEPLNYRVNEDRSELEKVKRYFFELNESNPEKAAMLVAAANLKAQGYGSDVWQDYADPFWDEMLQGLTKKHLLILVDELKAQGFEVVKVAEDVEMHEYAACLKSARF